MYLYESHLGQTLYTTDMPLFDEELYCEVCGDSDWGFGWVETPDEVLRLLADRISVSPEDGGYDLDYIIEFLNENFPENTLSKEDIKRIVLSELCKTYN